MEQVDTNIHQGSDEWKALLSKTIGSSDAAVIMGVSPYKTRYQLWSEMVSCQRQEIDNPAMAYGRKNEPFARQLFEEYIGCTMLTPVLLHPLDHRIRASYDGMNLEKTIACEIKCCNLDEFNLVEKGVVPARYVPQLQHLMMVASLKKIYYVAFHGGEISVVEVESDEHYIDRLFFEEQKFLAMVEILEAPELCDKDYVERDEDLWKVCATKWKIVNRQLKGLEDEEQSLRKVLIGLSMGQSSKGAGIQVVRSMRKGSVDYEKMIKKENLDLEIYRRPSVETWRISESRR